MGDNAVALTGSAYYKLAGWQVMEGDKPHNINYGTYTLADLAKIAGSNQVILRPVYVYNGQDVFTVSLDGQQLWAKGYDVRVKVPKAADAYALAVKTGSTYAIATYGNAYDFYIDGSNKEFFTVNYLPAEKDERGDVIRAAGYYVTDGGQLVRLDTDANIRYSLEHKFPTAFSVGMKSKSAATTFSTYSAATTGLPADVKITEMGTLYTRDAAMATDAAFTVDSVQAGKNVKMARATDAAQIKKMGIRIKDLEAVGKHQITVDAPIQAEIRDSTIVYDTITVSIRKVEMDTPHLKLDGTIEDNLLKGKLGIPSL